MKSKEKKESQDTINISAENIGLTNFQNTTGAPVFVNPNISGSVTYNTETPSSPTIESTLKFERSENYYSLKEPIVFGGQTETKEYKLISDIEFEYGEKFEKKGAQYNHSHHKIDEKTMTVRREGFFSRFIKMIFRRKK